MWKIIFNISDENPSEMPKGMQINRQYAEMAWIWKRNRTYCQYYQPTTNSIIIIIIIVCNTNTFLHSFLIQTARDLRIGENAVDF